MTNPMGRDLPGFAANAARPMAIPTSNEFAGWGGAEAEQMDDGNLRVLVGSPDDISALQEQMASSRYTPRPTTPSSHSAVTLNAQTVIGPSRPHFARSVTSPPMPTSSNGDRASSNAALDAAGGALGSSRLSLRDRTKGKGHEWTVFGELMGITDSEGDDRTKQSASSSSALRPGARESLQDFIVRRPSRSPVRRQPFSRSVPSSPAYELQTSTLSMEDDLDRSDGTMRDPEALSDIPDYDSDAQSVSTINRPQASSSRQTWRPSLPTLSPLSRNILKCCVAYFIGSLFTYSPYLSGLIADITGGDPGERAPSPSGHIVTTM